MSKSKITEDLRADILIRAGAGDSTRQIADWLKRTHGLSLDFSTIARAIKGSARRDTTVSQALADSAAARARLVTVQTASVETVGDLAGLAAVVDGLTKDAETLTDLAAHLREGAIVEESGPRGSKVKKFDLRRIAEARRHSEAAITARGAAAHVLRARIGLAQQTETAAPSQPGPAYYVPRGIDDPHALAKLANGEE